MLVISNVVPESVVCEAVISKETISLEFSVSISVDDDVSSLFVERAVSPFSSEVGVVGSQLLCL